jgi:hypothetical protein
MSFRFLLFTERIAFEVHELTILASIDQIPNQSPSA